MEAHTSAPPSQNTRQGHASSARTRFSARTCLQVALMSPRWLCARALVQGKGEAGLRDTPPSRGGSGTPCSAFWQVPHKVTGLEGSRGDSSREARARPGGAAVGFCPPILPPSCPPAWLAATSLEVDSQCNKISYRRVEAWQLTGWVRRITPFGEISGCGICYQFLAASSSLAAPLPSETGCRANLYEMSLLELT